MKSDSKMAASLDPAVLAERFQALATKSQAAVQGFLLDRPDVANIGMGDPANSTMMQLKWSRDTIGSYVRRPQWVWRACIPISFALEVASRYLRISNKQGSRSSV